MTIKWLSSVGPKSYWFTIMKLSFQHAFVTKNTCNSMLDKLNWYWSRFTGMSGAKIIHRIIESSKKWADHRLDRGWESLPAPGPLRPIASVTDRLLVMMPDLSREVGRAAHDVRSGLFNLLGAQWPKPLAMPPPPNFWHTDPGTGELNRDRNKYCFDISFRHGINVQELKRIWEINRLQFLVPLAVDAAQRGDSATRNLVHEIVLSWMDANQPYRGINWSSGIELSLRVISVALSLSIVGLSHLSKPVLRRLQQFFAAHVRWIVRYPSLYSSANNHLVAELAGLIVATSFAPHIPGANALQQQSFAKLLNELQQQLLPDGVGVEQSPSYSAFMIELALLALLVGNQSAPNLPDAVRARLAAWAEHVRWMMDADGRVPQIGDCDDCRAIGMIQGPENRYVASIVAAVSGYLQRPELAPPTQQPHLRDLIFGSPNTFSLAPIGIKSWQAGGYTVIRGRATNPIVLIIDHGPLGYLSIAAHGHADTLAIWLSVGHQPVIVDAGTYLYHSDAIWRNRFRCTPLHNTLTISGESSSRPAGPFNWATKANARLVSATADPHPRVTVEHDGYSAHFSVRHQRTLDVLDDTEIVITDELVGVAMDQPVAISFLIDPSCRAIVNSSRTEQVSVTNDRGEVLHMISDGPLWPRIVRGDEVTGLGWISPSFGLCIPTDQIVFEGHLEKSSTIRIHLR
jgi:uncharacterized heparinase superfamily protein